MIQDEIMKLQTYKMFEGEDTVYVERDDVLEVLKQEPCEDCISREAVDEYITNLLSGYLYDEERTRLEDLSAFVWELQPVTPQQKIGHWLNLENTKYKGKVLPFWGRYECSKCGGHGEGTFDYCPNCGAKMESEG